MNCTDEILALTADELRAKLIELGMPEEEALQLKGKNNLREEVMTLIDENMSDKQALNELASAMGMNIGEISNIKIVDFEEEPGNLETEYNNIPKADGSRVWHDYVMSQFTEDELSTGAKPTDIMPRLFGLRRIAELLVGEIVENVVDVIEVPRENNGWTSTVKSFITLIDHNTKEPKQYSDVAEVNASNSKHPFTLHRTSTAASKAEARCLRKILKLRNVIAAEEYSDKKEEEVLFNPDGDMSPVSISDTQLVAIDHLCKKTDINVMKFINKNPNEQYDNIKLVPFNRAKDILGTLHKFSNKNDGFAFVPAEFAGYDAAWNTGE